MHPHNFYNFEVNFEQDQESITADLVLFHKGCIHIILIILKLISNKIKSIKFVNCYRLIVVCSRMVILLVEPVSVNNFKGWSFPKFYQHLRLLVGLVYFLRMVEDVVLCPQVPHFAKSVLAFIGRHVLVLNFSLC